MTTWRHAAGTTLGECMKPTAPGMPMPCGCTSPLPDPASPCGFERCVSDTEHRSWRDPSRFPADMACLHEERDDCHPHVPSLCAVCHHPIVEADPYAETRRLRREFEDFAVATPEATDA